MCDTFYSPSAFSVMQHQCSFLSENANAHAYFFLAHSFLPIHRIHNSHHHLAVSIQVIHFDVFMILGCESL